LTTKWRILWKKLQTFLKNSARIIEACARMHNYLLNCKEGEDEDSPKDEPEIHVMKDFGTQHIIRNRVLRGYLVDDKGELDKL
jgi:hypothetical protein